MAIPTMTDHPRIRASLAQQGIWFNERLGGLGTVYSMPFSVLFTGPLDVAALDAACTALVRRHPLLAAVVAEDRGEPYLVESARPPRLAVVEVAGREPDELVRAELLRPFDLRTGPLVRLTLLVEGPERALLLVVAHHLVFDGESTSVFLDDLAELYRAEVTGRAADLPEVPYDGLAEREDTRVTATLAQARDFWAARHRERTEVVLPGLTGEAATAASGESVEFTLTGELSSALDRLGLDTGASRFEILLATLHALLHRYGNAEPTVAVDLGTRTADTRQHIGAFVNELPVTARLDGSWSFRRFLQDQRFAHGLRSDLPGLFRVREVPLSRAVRDVRPGVALAPVSLGYRRRGAAPSFEGVRADVTWALFNHTVRGALRVHVVDGPDKCGVILQYDPATMRRESAQRVAAHWLRLLADVTADPDTRLSEVELLGADETEPLLGAWIDTSVAYPSATLPELVVRQARHAPEAVAVRHGPGATTYAELAAEVEGLAVRLREAGVGPGTLVAVLAERSRRTLAVLLAVLRAGGAYLPLDPEHPADRLAFILDDSGAKVVVVSEALRERLPCGSATTVLLSDTLEPAAGDAGPWPEPDSLAYVMYTSGSTGRPKGVEIPHRALANLLWAMRDRLGSRSGDVWLAATSLAFDISALELYLPLITGGSVVLAPDALTRDGRALAALADTYGVTHVQATPSGWRMLLDGGFDRPAVTALAGGERLTAPLAAELLARTGRLINVYGPTETTIWSTSAEVTQAGAGVPIGTPLANTRVYVLDDRLRLRSVGVPGELCVAGDGVADGYRGRPELTAERFVADPFGKGLMYRTGDLARWREDGMLEFLGRLDDQVKLRGHRIEPGEIEARLAEHPSIAHGAVAVRGDRLVAYAVLAAGAPGLPAGLREHCARTLPPYMVPAEFVELDALPLTPNGKVDRGALPEPPARDAPPPETGAPVAALTGAAAVVHDIWCDVLGVDRVGPHDDLFDLGGHSLTITQIAARVRSRLGADLPLHLYYDDPTIAGIAAAVERSRGEG